MEVSKEKDNEFPFGFNLIYNGKAQPFRTKDESVVKEWLEALSWYCVALDFEKKYKIMNKIGSGGYAKVFVIIVSFILMY